MPGKPRILVIRGGAIGDFILTLPAIRLLREAFAHCELVLLGYPHIVELANGRFYADEVRNIEYGPMSRFFIPNADLDRGLMAFFGGFQQVVSYLYDPDRFFRTNLERCGVKHFIQAHPKISDGKHAVEQLAEPLQRLALYLEDATPRLYLTAADRERAGELLDSLPRPFLAIHPGSGSPRKNWPVDHFRKIMEKVRTKWPAAGILLTGGEADREVLRKLAPLADRCLDQLTLPELAAVLAEARFYLGHDTGVSHMAGAVGTPCLLLFGPTDPEIWAPTAPQAEVLRAPLRDGEESEARSLDRLEVETVWERLQAGWDAGSD